jgi:hypothetical protein
VLLLATRSSTFSEVHRATNEQRCTGLAREAQRRGAPTRRGWEATPRSRADACMSTRMPAVYCGQWARAGLPRRLPSRKN